jgi:hypothetical protein
MAAERPGQANLPIENERYRRNEPVVSNIQGVSCTKDETRVTAWTKSSGLAKFYDPLARGTWFSSSISNKYRKGQIENVSTGFFQPQVFDACAYNNWGCWKHGYERCLFRQAVKRLRQEG